MWDKSGWYSLHTGNCWLIDCFLWAIDKITRICRHFTPKVACRAEWMCARLPLDVVWMNICVHEYRWTWSEWIYVCTSTSGRGLNEWMCAQVPPDVVLQGEECLIEHFKLSIKDECHCPKGFWGKMQNTFSPYRGSFWNSRTGYTIATILSTDDTEKILNVPTIQEPLRVNGLVAQWRASWWKKDINCGCRLQRQLWRGGRLELQTATSTTKGRRTCCLLFLVLP